ncbi:hypothetical protein [Chitinophaga flava]|nr:hypothetical protein [Chitinophaga flava]
MRVHPTQPHPLQRQPVHSNQILTLADAICYEEKSSYPTDTERL